MVLVTPYFRYLASAPKVHWQAGAAAPALDPEPKLLPELAHTTTSLCDEDSIICSWEGLHALQCKAPH